MLTCFRTICDLLTHVFAARSRVEAVPLNDEVRTRKLYLYERNKNQVFGHLF